MSKFVLHQDLSTTSLCPRPRNSKPPAEVKVIEHKNLAEIIPAEFMPRLVLGTYKAD